MDSSLISMLPWLSRLIALQVMALGWLVHPICCRLCSQRDKKCPKKLICAPKSYPVNLVHKLRGNSQRGKTPNKVLRRRIYKNKIRDQKRPNCVMRRSWLT